VLSTNNDHAYRVALDWLDAGLQVVAIADAPATRVARWWKKPCQRHPSSPAAP
jgi:hypothetical protein